MSGDGKSVLVVHSQDRAEVRLGLGGDEGVIRRLFTAADGSSVVLGSFRLDVGQRGTFRLPSDSGVTEEMYYLLAGTLRVSWGDRTAEARPGDSIFFPPGNDYTIEALGSSPVELVWTAYPAPSP